MQNMGEGEKPTTAGRKSADLQSVSNHDIEFVPVANGVHANGDAHKNGKLNHSYVPNDDIELEISNNVSKPPGETKVELETEDSEG